ncbi:MAG TPA: hypothetical protein VK612_09045 [Pyrinomonadaceae bacterium]|nr:hypothetical protein [Pyrinomonadaceae bacterium]
MLLGLDVHEYRNNELGAGYSTAAGLVAYEKLKGKIKSYGDKIGLDKYWVYYPLHTAGERKKDPGQAITDYLEINIGFPLYNVFVGKGSPDNIAKAVQLAVAFGLIEGTLSAMQKYCDANIGIDCSGFASNYFGLDSKAICNLGASKMAPPDKRVSKLEDVRAGTAIVFKSGKHVALVDEIRQIDRTDNGIFYAMNCMVAESTADKMVEGGPDDGLNYTEYVLLVTNNKADPSLFKILRPLHKASTGIYGVDVHLANWPVYDLWD